MLLPYFACLQSHLPDDTMWQLFTLWKTAAGVYSWGCRQLTETIVKECARRTKPPMLIAEEWPQEGVFWYFAQQVYVHHTSHAEGLRGLEGLTFGDLIQEIHEGFPKMQSRVAEQGTVFVLDYAGRYIACHRDEGILLAWRREHQGLLASDDFTQEAKDLVAQHKALDELTDRIKEPLRKDIERGVFDRGRCGYCP